MSNIPRMHPACQLFLGIKNSTLIEIVNYLISSSNRYKIVFPSRELIAKEAGCSLRSVGNHLRTLTKIGIIKKTYRHRTSSVYKLSVILFQYINVFKDKFKSLKNIIHLSLKYPKISAIKRVMKRAFSQRLFTRIFKKICPPLRQRTSSLRTLVYSYSRRERDSGENLLQFQGTGVKIKFRSRRRMDSIKMSHELRQVTKKLNLTKWGQIKLICFPDEALAYALYEIQKPSNKNNSFSWFFVMANRYCIDQDIDPDWPLYYKLSEKHKMPENPNFVGNNPKPDYISVKGLESKSTHIYFIKARTDRLARTKDDKGYKQRVSYFQQFKPEFLKENSVKE